MTDRQGLLVTITILLSLSSCEGGSCATRKRTADRLAGLLADGRRKSQDAECEKAARLQQTEREKVKEQPARAALCT